MTVEIIPLFGIGEVHSGDDLASVIINATNRAQFTLDPSDVIVVTSKVVSKAEGAVIEGADREAAIVDQTARVVARRGQTTISQTHHGFVMAAAGVDASDIPTGQVALLPRDPDASARGIRARLRELAGVAPAVIVSDTFGRPWREGLIDQALGVAGIAPLMDLRGSTDTFGRPLQATIMAIADEIASASELVRVKAARVPVAIIRGLGHLVGPDDGPGIAPVLRSGESDWFRYGHRDLVTSRRTVRDFLNEEVPRSVITVALQAAVTAPAPHHTRPMRFVVLETASARTSLLKAMEDQWRTDLFNDGLSDDQVEKRIARGALLHRAPVLIAPFLVRDGAHTYPDQRRSTAEERMFTLAAGAAVENLLIALHGEGLGSAWVSSSVFCPDAVRRALEVDPAWEPVGLVAVGYPNGKIPDRAGIDINAVAEYR